tara:strand:- start:614 stop:829 length:216 start_codon:yes stop_codon:yes gene_type:complete
MYLEYLLFDGYGLFVWTAFFFTFTCFLSLYLKTKREFEKQEKLFLLEFKKVEIQKIVIQREKEVLSASVTF